MNTNGISVIIPNYNGEKFLPEIFPSLFEALGSTGLPFEIILCDDCSTDSSVNFIKKEYPSVLILENETNKGFSPTINKGIFAARFSYLLLLNSDVKLVPGYFDHLLRYFEKPDTFGVMGRIIGWDDDILQDGAKYPSFHGAKIKTSGNYIASEPQKNDWLYSFYLSGANAFVDREKIIRLKGFDELYAPFYIEDVDLSLRAWRIGYKCYYEHFAVCRHKVSVSIKAKQNKNKINCIYNRNKFYLHQIHLSGWQLWLWKMQLIPETLLHFFTGRFYFISAFNLFFKNRRKALESKARFNKLHTNNEPMPDVKEIANSILSSLKNREIIRL